MSKIDFTGRVAIITGAGAGLGRDCAIEMAKRGAKVVVNDLGGPRDGSGEGTASPADSVVAEIKAAGGEAVANYDNVAEVAGGENMVKTAIDNYGKVDIVVNNAGILRDKSFLKMEPENWDAVLAVHLRGAYCVTRPAFANMKENAYGRIIMTSSSSGVFGNFGQTNYGAAKMGLAGLANVLKLEGAKYNIKVNVLLPGAGTRLTEDVMPPEVFERMKVEYVTPATLYLCSEQCEDSGLYINAGAGRFSRSNIVTGLGVQFEELPSPEDIQANWDAISSLEGAEYFPSTTEWSAFAAKAPAGKKA
jgi:NAD(P)-dependent dehydrogenase (short-subunit alcohol dehydrogenase family)